MTARSLRSRDVFSDPTTMAQGKSKGRGGSAVKYKAASKEELEHVPTQTPPPTGGAVAADQEDERSSSKRRRKRMREERLVVDLPECQLSNHTQTPDWDCFDSIDSMDEDLASLAAAERRNREERVSDVTTELGWDDMEAVDLVDFAGKKRRKRGENPPGIPADLNQDQFSEDDLVCILDEHRKEEAKEIEIRRNLIRVSSELLTKECKLMAELVVLQKSKTACNTSMCEVEDRLASCRAYVESTEVELAAIQDKRREEEALRRNALERKLRKDCADAALKLEVQKDKTVCQICMNSSRNALVLPCMHFLYCSECLQKHQKTRNDCPTCRGPITALLLCKLSSD